MNNHIYCVILAGGNSERLWPISRQHTPKQLLSLTQQGTLLAHAIDLVCPITAQERIWVVTTQQHSQQIQQEVEEKVGAIVIEPEARNTAAAIMLACKKIAEIDPHAVAIFLPADQIIETKEIFTQFLHHAIDFASENSGITLLGLPPTHPATGYGYIEYKDTNTAAPYKVKKFHEKPDEQHAQKYMTQQHTLWNIGIFCAQVTTFLEEFSQHAPDIAAQVTAYVHERGTYADIRADSFDKAVLEKSNNVYVLPVTLKWHDVGNIATYVAFKHQEQHSIISIDAHNNLVTSKQPLIVLIDVADLCVVQTDDVLLITKQQSTEKIRSVVHELKKRNAHTYI